MSSYQGIAPASKFVAHTKSDTEFIKYGGVVTSTKGIYVGGAGDVAVKNARGETVLIEAVPVGSILPIVTTQILATNTSASKFIAIF